MNHTRYVLKHHRGSIFSSRLAADKVGFSMETLAVVHGASEVEVRDRAELVREAFAAAGKGYLPGPQRELPRVA